MLNNDIENVVIRGFVENGLLVSSKSNPEIEFPYAIFKYSDLSLAHLVHSVRNANLVYPILKKINCHSIYFYVNGWYPFIYNMKNKFKNVVIFTTEEYKKYYTNFCSYKNVFVEENFEDILYINNDHKSSILHYYIVEENPVDVCKILDHNIEKTNIIIQNYASLLAEHFKVVNRNYKILDYTYERGRNGLVIARFGLR